ncbi:hypothetical protein CJ030_MR8G005086 [Morella rubra]|uniref:PB1-like domain-containing protein n=1 Tax=Morella rubra TaxID=262757 RepID=A0A6A1UXM0_9ROSI|nr:hypothetical protein CJ030_MR8G005086 [Morella rubra]
MALKFFLFEVHYSGRFSRQFGCTYVGGDVDVYDEPYDLDCLSFFELEAIVKPFGYKAGDLVYYKQPTKNLDERLQLVSSDHDVLEMVKCHEGQSVIVLGKGVTSLGLNDPFWDQVLNSDEEFFDVGVDHTNIHGIGSSSVGGHTSSGIEGGDGRDDEGHRDGMRGKAPMREADEHESDIGEGIGSDIVRSDILVSPEGSDEAEDASNLPEPYRGPEFQETNMLPIFSSSG